MKKRVTIDERIYKNTNGDAKWRITNDVIFKATLGTDSAKAKKALIYLCNAVLMPRGYERIVEITYLNPFNYSDFVDDKLSVLDIKVKTETDIHMNIEMQVTPQKYYIARSLYYWAKLYHEQLQKAENFPELKKTIGIHFIEGKILGEDTSGHSVHLIHDKDTKKVTTDFLELHFVQMSRIHDIMDSGEQDLANLIYFMKCVNDPEKKSELESLINKEEVLQTMMEEYTKVTSDQRLRNLIDARQKWQYDHNSDIYLADKDGEARGIKIGIEQGIEQGMEQKQLAMVKRMNAEGLTIEVIAKCAELSVDDVKQMLKQ